MMLFEGNDRLRGEALNAVLGTLVNRPIWGWADHRAEEFDHHPVFGTMTAVRFGIIEPGVESDGVFRKKEWDSMHETIEDLCGELAFD